MCKVTWLSSTTDFISSSGLLHIKFSNLLKIELHRKFLQNTFFHRTHSDDSASADAVNPEFLWFFICWERKNYVNSKGLLRPERYFKTIQTVPTLSDNEDTIVKSWSCVKSAILICYTFFCLKFVYNRTFPNWTVGQGVVGEFIQFGVSNVNLKRQPKLFRWFKIFTI